VVIEMKINDIFIIVLIGALIVIAVGAVTFLFIENKGIMGATPNLTLTENTPSIICSYLNNTFVVAHFNIPWSYYNKNEYKYFINSSYNGEREILDQKSGYITIASPNKDEYMSIVVENINNGNRIIMIYTKCEGEYK
jgi:hypothetical protein